MDVKKYLQGFFAGTKNPSLDAMRFFMDKLKFSFLIRGYYV